MLHIEGRQGGQKNSSTLILKSLLVCFSLLMLGCTDSSLRNKKDLSLDTFKEMKVDEYALSSQSFRENLEHFCVNEKGHTFAATRLRHYYSHGGPLVWVDKWGADSRADSLVAVLERLVPEIGFSEKLFRLADIKADLHRLQVLQFDDSNSISLVLARLEYNLSRAYLTYVTGQRFGFVNPNNVLNRYDARDKDSTGRVIAYRHLYDVNIECPTDSFLKVALGHVTVDSLGTFLRRVEPSVPLYSRLRQMLKEKTDSQRQRILVNMERCRWRDRIQPQSGQKYIVVNVPAYHLWAVSPDTIVDMRAACGALKTKTPLLSSRITHMQVNPEWVIPMSIIRDDVARHGGDFGYFARHRYYISERKTGKRLSPDEVTPAMLRSGNYRVSQEGGAGNSLGRIIFRFPNNFSVFLHDTSSPGVFQRDNRGVSHGCVRVQRPFDLAVFLMEENPDSQLLDKLRISMGMSPETDWGRDQLDLLDPAEKTPKLVRSITVSPRVPIIITYYTIFQAPDGSIHNFPDVYGYDRAISEALKPYVNND